MVFNNMQPYGVFRSHTMRYIYAIQDQIRVHLFLIGLLLCGIGHHPTHLHRQNSKNLKICNSTPAQRYHLSYALTEPIVLCSMHVFFTKKKRYILCCIPFHERVRVSYLFVRISLLYTDVVLSIVYTCARLKTLKPKESIWVLAKLHVTL